MTRCQDTGVAGACLRATVAFAAFAALLVAGCANLTGAGLVPGSASDAVQATMGPPQRVWADPNGGQSWEYARGPEGRETYMVRIGPDGRLQQIDQVLSEEYFARVTPGMSKDDVARLLGRPFGIVDFPRLGEEVWSWRYTQANVWALCFYAHFDRDGRLARTSRGMEDAPDDWPRRFGC
jgi:hypothetical protein